MRRASYCILLLLAAFSCNAAPLVLTTHPILEDWAKNVAGEDAQVQCLQERGTDPHSPELRPAKMQALAKADLVVENGLHFEPWLDDAYASSTSQALRCTASKHIAHKNHHHHKHGSCCSCGHHEGNDPHFWLNPHNAIHAVETITEALAQIDPDHAESYQQRAAAYITELQTLYSWARGQSLGGTPIILLHDSLGYLLEIYPENTTHSLLASNYTEGIESSAAHLARLTDYVHAHPNSRIFFDSAHAQKLTQTLLSETGQKPAGTLYTESLGTQEGEPQNYIAAMYHNIQALTAATPHAY